MERSGYWLHKWTDETSSFDPHGRWSGGLDCYERDYSMWIPDRIKPDDTVAVNDYIDRQFELSAEVADGLEVIDAADAQATIVALQARVRELEEITKVICGHCCEPMEIPSKAVLQSQLTQRTAELEAAKQWKLQLCNLTPGGSEFADDPAYCAEWVRKSRENQHNVILDKYREAKSLKAELERVRGLIKALPKVEGEIEVKGRSINERYPTLSWQIASTGMDEFTNAIAALLQHRQGMEGV